MARPLDTSNPTQTNPSLTIAPSARVPGGVSRKRPEVKPKGRPDRSNAQTAAERASSESFRLDSAWARDNLPREAPAFAATAYAMCRRVLGREPTAEEVRTRLVATGRDRDSVNALAKKYGTEPLP